MVSPGFVAVSPLCDSACIKSDLDSVFVAEVLMSGLVSYFIKY